MTAYRRPGPPAAQPGGRRRAAGASPACRRPPHGPHSPRLLDACPPSCPSSSRCTTRRTSCRCSWSGCGRCSTASARRTRCSRSTTAAGTPPRCCCSGYRRDWPQLRVVRLRANAGHQAAISAGLARARGDYVATLDADLQDPPEVIAEMLAAARRDGVDVVYGVRADRSTDSAFKRGSARAFYRLIRRVSGTTAPADAGDFRLMSRATVDAVNSLPEHHRVLRFVVPALGFPSGEVRYRRDDARRRQLEVPAGPDDPALGGQPDRVLHRSPAPGHLVRPRRRPRGARRCWSTRSSPSSAAARSPAGPRPSSPWPPSARCSCSASGCSASTSAGCTRDAGPPVVLRGLRLARGQPGRRAVTRSVTPGRRRTGR